MWLNLPERHECTGSSMDGEILPPCYGKGKVSPADSKMTFLVQNPSILSKPGNTWAAGSHPSRLQLRALHVPGKNQLCRDPLKSSFERTGICSESALLPHSACWMRSSFQLALPGLHAASFQALALKSVGAARDWWEWGVWRELGRLSSFHTAVWD